MLLNVVVDIIATQMIFVHRGFRSFPRTSLIAIPSWWTIPLGNKALIILQATQAWGRVIMAPL
jgi:hypothetical protein